MFSTCAYTNFFTFSYKPIGYSAGISDDILTWATSIGTIVNCSSRFICGFLFDYVGFKKLAFVILAVE